jgi:hypothetical protein
MTTKVSRTKKGIRIELEIKPGQPEPTGTYTTVLIYTHQNLTFAQINEAVHSFAYLPAKEVDLLRRKLERYI